MESLLNDAPSESESGSLSRYAVYLIPSGPWLRLGQRWLGRNAGTGERIARPGIQDQAAIDAWTQAPRLYGLHATLKPPFRLSPGTGFSDLDEGLRRLAASMSSFEIPLQLTPLRGFLAWCVDGPTPVALTKLANACVADLDHFRAPPSAEEIARRSRHLRGGALHSDVSPTDAFPPELAAAQAHNLQRWGYPYVFDTFVFHVTLTGRLDEPDLAAAVSALSQIARADEMATLQPGSAMPVTDIGLFVQAAPGLPFVIARRYGFDGSVRDGRPDDAVDNVSNVGSTDEVDGDARGNARVCLDAAKPAPTSIPAQR